MKKDYSKIEIDREAIEASKKDVGFKQYIYNGQRIEEDDHLRDSMIYMLNTQKMYFPSWDARRPVKPLARWQKVKNYFATLWLAIKGYNFED